VLRSQHDGEKALLVLANNVVMRAWFSVSDATALECRLELSLQLQCVGRCCHCTHAVSPHCAVGER